MREMDIERIDYRDNTFDLICCSHVLEHVENDRKAIAEIYRVCKVGGGGIFLVPITSMPTTYEDPSITGPKERLVHFGDKGHLRIYGADFIDRLTSAGFRVSICRSTSFLNEQEINVMGLRSVPIFHCFKEEG